MTCWIAMHWPRPASLRQFFWHVYVKRAWGLRSLPHKDDIVLVYETKTATVNRRRVCRAKLWRPGAHTAELVDVPVGEGGIIGRMRVSGTKRAIWDDDFRLDYGNLRDWEIIPCHEGHPVEAPLLRPHLMEALGYPPHTPPRFLRLWQVPDELCSGLLAHISLPR